MKAFPTARLLFVIGLSGLASATLCPAQPATVPASPHFPLSPPGQPVEAGRAAEWNALSPDEKKFVEDIEQLFEPTGSVRLAAARLNSLALIKLAATDSPLSSEQVDVFTQKMPAKFRSVDIFQNLKDKISDKGRFRFLRAETVDGARRIVFRAQYPNGMNYLHFALVPGSHPLVSNDFYSLVTGQLMSDSLAAIMPKFIGKAGSPELREAAMAAATLDQMEDALDAKEYQKVLDLYAKLPRRFQRSRNSQLIRMQAANYVSQDQFNEAVAELALRLPNDASIALLTAAAYQKDKQFNEALEAINTVDATYHDEYLNDLRSSISISAGKPREALLFAKYGLAADPLNRQVVDDYLTAALAADDSQAIADALDRVELDLGTPVHDLTNDPHFASFVTTLAYASWNERHLERRKQHTKPAPRP